MSSSVPPPSPEVNVLFFDAAGTLLHTAEPVGDTYARVAAKHGAALDAALLHRGFKEAFAAVGTRGDETVPRNGDDRVWWREIVRRSLATQALPADFPFEACFEELYLHFARPGAWAAYPEVAATLETLRERGHRLAVLSNWDGRLRPVLDGLGLARFFEALFISAEMGTAKPSPTIYRQALAAMGCRTEEAAMIGDEPENDVEIPRALGMAAYHVERPGRGLDGVLDFLNGPNRA